MTNIKYGTWFTIVIQNTSTGKIRIHNIFRAFKFNRILRVVAGRQILVYRLLDWTTEDKLSSLKYQALVHRFLMVSRLWLTKSIVRPSRETSPILARHFF